MLPRPGVVARERQLARHEDGAPISRRVFEHLSCDATIRGVVMSGPGEPLVLGRSQWLGTPGQRRAAAIRDGGCVYPGCERPPDQCDLHHIRHWVEHQGPTDLAKHRAPWPGQHAA